MFPELFLVIFLLSAPYCRTRFLAVFGAVFALLLETLSVFPVGLETLAVLASVAWLLWAGPRVVENGYAHFFIMPYGGLLAYIAVKTALLFGFYYKSAPFAHFAARAMLMLIFYGISLLVAGSVFFVSIYIINAFFQKKQKRAFERS